MPLKIIIVPVWKEKNEAIWGDFLKKSFFPPFLLLSVLVKIYFISEKNKN